MYVDKSVGAVRTPARGDGEALVEGLTLLRASALKLIRLQLALSRNERRAAIEAVDDLLALDRNLRDYLNAFGPIADQSDIAFGIDCDRSALNSEKLSLSAEILCKGRDGIEPISSTSELEAVELEDLQPSPTLSPLPKPSSLRWLLLVVLLLAGLAAAAWWIAPGDLAQWAAQAAGMVR